MCRLEIQPLGRVQNHLQSIAWRRDVPKTIPAGAKIALDSVRTNAETRIVAAPALLAQRQAGSLIERQLSGCATALKADKSATDDLVMHTEVWPCNHPSGLITRRGRTI